MTFSKSIVFDPLNKDVNNIWRKYFKLLYCYPIKFIKTLFMYPQLNLLYNKNTFNSKCSGINETSLSLMPLILGVMSLCHIIIIPHTCGL